MFKRVYKTIIGKDLTRSAAPVLYATSGAAQSVQVGEVFVLDQYKKLAQPGLTFQDSPTIYIAVVGPDTVTYADKATNPNTLVGNRLIISDAIDGFNVQGYRGKPAQSTQKTVVTFTGITTSVAGVEYVLRVFFKDIPEHPGQFTNTFRVVAADAFPDNLGAALVTAINSYAARRFTATYTNGGTLTLTFNLPVSSTSTLDDIDEFQLPYGDAFLDYVATTATGGSYVNTYSYGQAAWQTYGATKVVTPGITGNGNWFQVRDAEKAALPNRGVINRTLFPVIKPNWFTQIGVMYNEIVIDHKRVARTPVLQQAQDSSIMTTRIFIPVYNGVIGTFHQMNDVLAVLNPWMNSIDTPYDPITNLI